MMLAAGGLAAAFGVAACCALPVLLGAVGAGGAWLFALARFAGPHQTALMALSLATLSTGGWLLWRHRAASCDADASCRRPVLRGLTVLALGLGAALLGLGYALG
jgi:mercuric ion transport protein